MKDMKDNKEAYEPPKMEIVFLDRELVTLTSGDNETGNGENDF